MFFQLGVNGIARGDLGWILSKHPDNTLAREVKKGRAIEGTWEPLLPAYIERGDGGNSTTEAGAKEKEDPHQITYYSYRGKNDPVSFMELMKFNNKASYVHASLSSICPYNLLGFREVSRFPPLF